MSFGIACGLVPPLFWPVLYPQTSHLLVERAKAAIPSSGLLGTAAGFVLGCLISWGATGKHFRPWAGSGYAALGLAFAGAFLGPQAVLSIGVATAAILLTLRIAALAVPRLHFSATVLVTGITFLWIVFWRYLSELELIGNYQAHNSLLLGAIIIVLSSALLLALSRHELRRR
jgi:hypothetical protein